MSLGVLNNINAIYAQNNLNNTSNSLSKVLQQLSSGSKISSGADDAAGLSLVNGLQANSQALAQSSTNASEGVGLLSVADGALSQVTNLLNRAVTLATEASNGTLNTSQDTAANQEYQSILSEISNIGSTTTYNNQSVFGTTTNIFTGDSSAAGASVNSLNIRSLSSSNVGDSNGAMAYSNGANNVFLDLSSGGTNAAQTDSLGASTKTTTISVGYMAKGTNGSAVAASANIAVGAGTSYANTAQGLISAINGAGLGLTAAFGTAAQAGSTATSAAGASNTALSNSTDTGIIITGVGVGAGTNGAGEIGTLTTGGASDLLGGSLNITDTAGTAHTIALGTANSTDNLANLASTINAAGYGVTATVNAGVVNGHAAGSVLTFSSPNAAVSVTGTSVTDASTTTLGSTPFVSATQTAGVTAAGAATLGTLNVTAANQQLSGTMTLSGAGASATVVSMNVIAGLSSGVGAASTITLGVAGQTDTVTNLANFINNNKTATSNVTAVVSNNGTTMTLENSASFTAVAAAYMTFGSAVVANTAVSDSLTGSPTAVNSAPTYTIGTMTGATSSSTYNAVGTLTLGSSTLALGATSGNKTDTLADIAATVNKGNYGVTASLDKTGTVLSFSSANSADAFNVSSTATTVATSGAIEATTNAADPTQMGSITYTNTGVTATSTGAGVALVAGDVISFGNGQNTYTVNSTDGLDMTSIASAINAKNLGINATVTTGGAAGTAFATLNFNSTTAATHGMNVSINAVADAGVAHVTSASDTATTGSNTYYSVGISGAVKDSTTGGGTLNTGMSFNNNGSGGVATITYSDSAGTSLSNTKLDTQGNAESALTALNSAITAVAAQDGYIGAQINTLNSVSSVLSTQAENVTSAQNAVQATDYASATSNMSKYQILSQTGISALAQANSMQQEVTKLLQ